MRREKAQELRELGVDPFGQKYIRTHDAKTIHDTYEPFDHDQLEEKNIEVSIAGRIVLKRGQGKAGFMHIKDPVMVKFKFMLDKTILVKITINLFKQADLGDIVGIKGILLELKQMNLQLKHLNYTHLTKL